MTRQSGNDSAISDISAISGDISNIAAISDISAISEHLVHAQDPVAHVQPPALRRRPALLDPLDCPPLLSVPRSAPTDEVRLVKLVKPARLVKPLTVTLPMLIKQVNPTKPSKENETEAV
jgi:hypothetical protein